MILLISDMMPKSFQDDKLCGGQIVILKIEDFKPGAMNSSLLRSSPLLTSNF